MKDLKKTLKALFSMRFALILLVLMIIACLFGSIIPQGEINAYYTAAYSEKLAMLILLLELDDVFHSSWFAVLTVFLCLNLLGCNIIRFPQILKQAKENYTPDKAAKSFAGEPDCEFSGELTELFHKMGFKSAAEGQTEDGRAYRYAVRHKAGLWGAWLTHLGMLIIILGFALGQMFTQSFTVYGVPGETKPIGNSGLSLSIDSFNIGLRDDETVEQYTSHISIYNSSGALTGEGETSVNHPLSVNGYKYYQNSTGWAAQVLIFEGEELLQDVTLCAGETLPVKGLESLVIAFSAFYPDYIKGPDGMPATASSKLENPGYLYSVYYNGSMIGMNVLLDDYITIDDYTVVFQNPQQYTLIQIKHDPFTSLALIGGVLICLALFIAFYYRLEELYAVESEGKWALYARSRKGGVLFKDKLSEAISTLK